MFSGLDLYCADAAHLTTASLDPDDLDRSSPICRMCAKSDISINRNFRYDIEHKSSTFHYIGIFL